MPRAYGTGGQDEELPEEGMPRPGSAEGWYCRELG